MNRTASFLRERRASLLLILSVGVYLFLLLDRLPGFPPYFFCDEAVVGVEARSILTTGADQFGARFPLFFRGLGQFQQGLQVYLQIPTLLLFGLNEFAVRLTNVWTSLLGVAAAVFWLNAAAPFRFGWLAFFFFGLSPLWFLHARTGFEAVPAASFFLAFLALYRRTLARGEPIVACLAALTAAFSFWCYTPARGWVGVTLALLLVLTFPELRRNRRAATAGALTLFILAIPYALFHHAHPEAAMGRLSALGFTQFMELSWTTRLQKIAGQYAAALNPLSWFTPSGTLRITEGGPRHFLPGFSALFAPLLPFWFVGVFRLIRGLRAAEHRILVAAILGVPFAGALVHFNTLRGLPLGAIYLWIAATGLISILALLGGRTRVRSALVSLLSISLLGYAFWFRHQALDLTPSRYPDYGFYGLQMGAPDVFRWIRENGRRYDHVFVGNDLFNAGEIFIPFYLDGALRDRTSITDVAALCRTPPAPIPPNAAYVVRQDTLREFTEIGCPLRVKTLHTIDDLRGRPLLSAVEPARGSGFEDWLRKREAERLALLPAAVLVRGARIEFRHPKLDMGTPEQLFDGKPDTFVRTALINPARFEFPMPREPIRRIRVAVVNADGARVEVRELSDGAPGLWGSAEFTGAHGRTRWVEVAGLKPLEGSKGFAINVLLPASDRYTPVHVGEIGWE